MNDPRLPPLYTLTAVGAGSDAFARAAELAAGPAEDGTIVWSRRPDRLDCALVFRPDTPLPEALPVVYPLALGLGDAFGALAPPIVALHFRWPDGIEVNGGLAGGLRARWESGIAPEEAPGWLVVGICVNVASDDAGSPERTSLQAEGCADITAIGLLESFSRHALAWINRWQEDGFAPVRAAWLSRAAGLDAEFAVALGDRRIAGQFAGLDDRGNLLLLIDRRTQTVALADVLHQPSWQL
jgi:biotin-(acetyl-CoA carboxylase) ligase